MIGKAGIGKAGAKRLFARRLVPVGWRNTCAPEQTTGPVAAMKAYDFTGVLLGMVCCAMSIFLLPAKVAAQSDACESATGWHG